MKNPYTIGRNPKTLIGTILIMVLLYSVFLFANQNGRIGRTSSTSQGCGSGCHGNNANSGTSVSVTSGTGSFTVAPNSTTTFTITVTNSNKLTAGVNIAVKTDQTGSTDAGSLSPQSGSGLQSSGGELTHTTPKTMSGGSASFTFTWTAPSSTGTYYLRAIGNATNNNGSEDSGDLWNWMTPQAIVVQASAGVTLTTPNGGDNWCPGSSHNITWTQSGVTNVKIELSSDGGNTFPTILIASTPASSGTWSWAIPSNQTTGSSYRVRISDASNASLSSSSQSNFTVPGAVTINTHPQNANVCTGTQASFSVSASGTGLLYQWKKNGANINGATQQTYSNNSVAGADSGSYTCLVSGDCGTPITSNAAVLSVDISPKITIQPVSDTVCVNDNAVFSITAEATNITYQWRKNGSNISGETHQTLTINGVKESDAGNYDCIVNGKCNIPQTSQQVALKVNTPPVITKQPQTINACLGKKAFIYITASGSNLVYKWKKNGNPIDNSNNDTLFFNSVSKVDEATYDVTVTGYCSPVASSSSALLVLNQITQITQEPSDKSVIEGTNADFTIISGGTNLKYQWRKDGKPLIGKTTADFHIVAVAKTDEGNYDCIVSGDCNSDTSKVAKLTVTSAGSGAILSLLHSSLDFGNTVVGSTRDTVFDAIIKNVGDKDLVITEIKITGADLSEFSLVGISLPLTIVKSDSKSLTIRFKPTKSGPSNAVIEFTSNSNQTSQLNMTGFGAVVKLGLPASPFNLSTTDKNNPATKTFSIENQGNIDLNLSLEFAGTNAADFSIIGDKSFIIPAGKTKDVTVQYNPGSGKTSDAVLNVKIAETGDVSNVTLIGNLVTTVTELDVISNFTIFPNPSNSGFEIKFNLETETEMDVRIINLNADVIKTFRHAYYGTGTNSIYWDGRNNSGNSVSAGSYRILYMKDSKIVSYPIVIEK